MNKQRVSLGSKLKSKLLLKKQRKSTQKVVSFKSVYHQNRALQWQLDYWMDQLCDAPVVHGLPLDYSRPSEQSYQGGVVRGQLPVQVSEQLTKLAQDQGMTLFMLLHAGFSLLLERHSNSTDIVIGTPVANRLQQELEPLVGFFVNTLVLRSSSAGHEGLDEYLQHIRQINLDAQAHQDIPFEHLVEHLQVPRDAGHSPLFQIMLAMNTNIHETLALDGVSFNSLDSEVTSAKFDVMLDVKETSTGLELNWTYDSALFSARSVERLNAHLERLLGGMAAAPQAPLRALPMLSEDERRYLIETVNDTQMAYPKDALVHELFEAQALATPDNVALVFEGQQMTYRQLNEKANQLAHYLLARGLTSGELVALSLNRSFTMIVAMLGILKAGGGYVPVDITLPQQRKHLMIEDAGTRFLITREVWPDEHPGLMATVGVEPINLDSEAYLKVADQCLKDNPDQNLRSLSPADPLYCLYTSGTTGKPKGVVMPHSSITNLLCHQRDEAAEFAEPLTTLQFTSIGFDVSCQEIMTSLISGGRLVIIGEQQRKDMEQVLALIIEHSIERLFMPYAALQALGVIARNQTARHYPIKIITTAGEQLQMTTELMSWLDQMPDVRLINHYGPTETHVATSYVSDSDFKHWPYYPPIGKAIANCKTFVLDKRGKLSPRGASGELYLGGEGVARGYLNQEELTASRFVADRFSDDPQARLYRTGDLVRYLENGDLEFLGRIDEQVKLRGFRIELGEIEHHLSNCEELASSVVMLREDEPGQKRLVAYGVLNQAFAQMPEAKLVERLQKALGQHVPEYMVPGIFMMLETLPLTPNGKINKKALPIPEGGGSLDDYVAPVTATEEALVSIWSDLLHIPKASLGAASSFFALGGHSLLSVRLVADIRSRLGVEVAIKQVFEHRTIQQLAAKIDQGSDAALRPVVVAAERTEHMPLSFAQQRLWFIDQFQGGSAHYNMPVALQVEGQFEYGLAEQALQRIVDRHEVLRTVYRSTPQGAEQVIQASTPLILAQHDLRDLDTDAQQAAVQRMAAEDAAGVFDLSADVMVRGQWLLLDDRDGQEQGVLLFNMHHIASDGWSIGVLVREFVQQYEALRAGDEDGLPALGIQYADYALWQRDYLQGEVLQQQLDYWMDQLCDAPVVHGLPLDYSRPSEQSYQGGVVRGQLPVQVSEQLTKLAQDQGMTLFMLLHAGFSLLLERHSNSTDIVIGTPVANRLQQELEPLVGFFVNTLVLRSSSAGHEGLDEYLQHIRQINLDAQAHQDIPFEHLVEHLQVPRDAGHSPLFQIMLAMNTNIHETLALDGVSFSSLDSEVTSAKFDVMLDVKETSTGLELNWTYDSALFSARSVERLNAHLERLLGGMAAAPQAPLRALPMLSEDERRYLIETVNDTQMAYPKDALVHELFEAQALATPDNVALVFEGQQMTYRQLNEKANQLGHYLRGYGIGMGQQVGIAMERSMEMVIGVLAILKTGGAYVALDPDYPKSRLEYILDDSQIEVLLTQSSLQAQFSRDNCHCLALDQLDKALSACSTDSLHRENQTPSDLAYIIYTSGSTGKPKGVMIEHRNAVALLCWSHQYFSHEELSSVLASTSLNFDLSVFEIFAPLTQGGCCVVVKNILSLIESDSSYPISLVNTVPSGMESLLQHSAIPNSVIGVNLAGEPLKQNLLNRLFEHNQCARVVNLYGPSEDTTYSTACSFDARLGTKPAIGKPICNTQSYVLDKNGNLCPIGGIGELYLGGEGVARGYLNQEELTASRFVADRFSDDPQARLYRTGDLVRYLENGDLEFLGRIDEQVKLRGFRIELGEIEHHLSNCEELASSVVMLREDEPGQKRLVAYGVLNQAFAQMPEAKLVERLQKALGQHVPEYMVPGIFMMLETLPLTPNGKINKKALPIPEGGGSLDDYVAPVTATEEALVSIWSDLLHIPKASLGAASSFFALGGHSLLSVRLVADIRSRLGVEVAIKQVFEHRTIQQLAAKIDQGSDAALRPVVVAAERTEHMPLSFAQQRLWFIDQFQGGSAHYNMPVALQVEGQFEYGLAEQALQRIVDRHEVLRTVYRSTPQGAEQVIQASTPLILAQHDLRDLDTDAQQAAVQRMAAEDAAGVFDLSADVMVRGQWLLLDDRDGQEQGVLLFNMHHIASDGWSIGVLVREFVQQYEALRAGDEDGLPALGIQYADYALWQRDYLQGEVLQQQLDYWMDQLCDAPVVHGLPLDYSRPSEQSYQGGVVRGQLPVQVSEQLTKLAQDQGMTLFMLLHAGFSLLLERHSNSTDIVIGTPVANRLQQELEPLVGFFVNTLVLRSSSAGHEGLDEYLQHIRQINLDAQAHQDIPFEHLVEHLQVPRDAGHSPLFQIMLAMNTNIHETLALDGVSFSSLDSEVTSAKFDVMLDVKETSTGLELNWTYDSALFSARSVERLNAHLERLLGGMAAAPQAPLRALPMLSEDERRYLIETVNDTQMAYPKDALVHELFEAQALATPDNVALVFEGQQMTYRQLNEKANQLAHYLLARGLTSGELVALSLNRSFTMIVAMLGILKAGGGYVPVDITLPQQRKHLMIEDAGTRFLITREVWPDEHPGLMATVGVEPINLDSEAYLKVADQCLKDNPDQNLRSLSPADPLYCLYTSGTTGKPKGVVMPHSSITNLLCHQRDEAAEFAEPLTTLQFTSIGFDVSCQEIMTSLISGGRLVIIGEQQRKDMEQVLALIIEHSIERLFMPYAALQALGVIARNQTARHYPIKIITTAGEQLQMTTELMSWLDQMPDVRLINHYGPTETHVATSYVSDSDFKHWPYYPPIGKAIANCKTFVLDKRGKLSPRGASGELYLGGEGVARGYLNQEELTASRFVADRFSDDPQARLYRTGDLVRYLENGDLEFLGRIDEQVKLRGFRIELGEIEHHLSNCEELASSVVMLREDEPGQKRLVAYGVLNQAFAQMPEAKLVERLQKALGQHVPEYMVPGIFMMLETLPLTPNGKINKKALPIPEGGGSLDDYVAPVTATEEALVSIWSDLLHIPKASLGAASSFFALGGHSLLSVRLVADIRSRLGVEVAIKQVFEHRTIQQLAAKIDQGSDAALRPVVVAAERTEHMPLSFAQQRLWFIDQFQGGSAHYNMPVALQVEGQFEYGLAEQALQRIVDRHEVLRTVYRSTPQGAEQVIQASTPLILAQHDLRDLDTDAQQAAVQRMAAEDAAGVFDLSADVMVRGQWLLLDDRDGQEQGVLLFNMHHIASDGWSIGVLVREFVQQYEALRAGDEDGLPALGIQYADYALWQRDYLQGEVLQQQLDYWMDQLCDAPVVHGLPLDYSRPSEQSYQGGVVRGQLPVQVSEQLTKLAQDQGMTLFMLLHAGFSLLLERHSNSTDIVIGTPVANRLQQELEPLVGFFVNTLVLRSSSAGHEGLDEYLQHIRQINLDAQAHQDIPFEHLVEHLQVPRDAGHSPLFQIMLAMNTNIHETLALDGVSFNSLDSEVTSAKFDVMLDVKETSTGLELNWTYDSALFSARSVERLNAHLERLLGGMAAAPQAPLRALPMLSEDERRYLIETVNDTQMAYPKDALVHELFEAQALATPDNVALVFEGQQMTYRQLNEKANQLGHYLRGYGIGMGQQVGIAMERSMEMVIGVLAILKTGGAYVALDPDYPKSRLEYILDDSQIEVLLTQSSLQAQFSRDNCHCLALDQLDKALSACSTDSLHRENQTPSDLAYIIYTSGSTGKPKGTELEHRGLVSLSRFTKQKMEITQKSRIMHFSSLGFDAATLEWAMALCNGASLHICSRANKSSMNSLCQFLEKQEITHAYISPALLPFLDSNREYSFEVIFSGGESCAESHAWKWAARYKYFNAYGPTECTVCTHMGLIEPNKKISIGTPNGNTTAYVLDEQQRLAPMGVPGELYVGGVGVARGYLNKQALTNDSFVPDRFSNSPDARLYRTGDLVRYLENGDLEFLGRIDEQVKLRGFRIELGEIEHHLSNCEDLAAGVVMLREDEPGQSQLVAYVVTSGGDSASESELTGRLQKYMLGQVPDYMVPAAFVLLDELPLTSHGKVDKKALPKPVGRVVQEEYVAPATATEEALVLVWSVLLHVPKVSLGTTNRFFSVGGNSLLAMRMVHHIEEHLDCRIEIADLFSYQTIQQLGKFIDQLNGPTSSFAPKQTDDVEEIEF